MKTTFTKDVNVPQRDASGKPLEADGKPIVAKPLGSFTFRHPTFADQKNIAVEMDRDFSGFGSIDQLRINTYYRVAVAAHFPRLVETAPEGWDWDQMTLEDGRALYETFLEEAGKNGYQGA